MPLSDDLMNMDIIGDDDNRAEIPDVVEEVIDKVEEARQKMVDCQGDRMFSDIGMDDEFWSLQNEYNKAVVDADN